MLASLEVIDKDINQSGVNKIYFLSGCHDTQHNDIQHKYTQHNDTECNNTQNKNFLHNRDRDTSYEVILVRNVGFVKGNK